MAISKCNTIEILYFDILVFLFKDLFLIFKDKYVKPSILDYKESLFYVIVKSFTKKNSTNQIT